MNLRIQTQIIWIVYPSGKEQEIQLYSPYCIYNLTQKRKRKKKNQWKHLKSLLTVLNRGRLHWIRIIGRFSLPGFLDLLLLILVPIPITGSIGFEAKGGMFSFFLLHSHSTIGDWPLLLTFGFGLDWDSAFHFGRLDSGLSLKNQFFIGGGSGKFWISWFGGGSEY